MELWQKILIGMALGVIVGALMGESATMLQPIGTIFIRLIKMLVVPLIFFSLISGITSLKDPSSMGRMGVKAVAAYIITTVFAIVIGLSVGSIIEPGKGMDMSNSGIKVSEVSKSSSLSFSGMLLNIIPTNPLEAMVEGNILQVIFFALLFGISLALMGERSKKIVELNNILADVMYKMTNIVMLYAPIGVFGLMAWVAGTNGLSILMPLMKVIIATVIAITLHVLIVYVSIIKFYLNLPVMHFFKHILDAQVVAFTTSSSSATLPVTMKVAEENLGISKTTSSFILPLGATINMDGSALYQGVCALFIAQAFGIDLSAIDMATIVLTTTLSSIGTAGIPGAGIVMMTLILSSVGLPIEAIALIAGVDRILDMLRTAINVTGDNFVALLIDKSEGTFDEGKYHL